MSPDSGGDDPLERARRRLEPLALYPTPVRTAGVHLLVTPWLFRLPWFRRFDGYATHRWIFLREPPDRAGDDLVCHELCHVWQMQHHPIRMPLSYLFEGYAGNPYEHEARGAVERTR